MSFDIQRQRRRVKVIPTTRTAKDKYGNKTTTKGTPVEVWASRQQLSADEDTSDRDQQAQTYTYFFAPSVVIDGRSLLEDEGKELKIIGEPEVLFDNLGKRHHIEARATLTEG